MVIDTDRIAREINALDPRAVDRAAGKRALALFAATLAAGPSMALETTLAGRSALLRLWAAKAAGCDVELRYVALAVVALKHPKGGGTRRRRHLESTVLGQIGL